MGNQRITITKLPIRLGQFLKFTDLVQDGLEAKNVILEGKILVNGEVERQRGRKLFEDDIVEYRKQQMKIVVSG